MCGIFGAIGRGSNPGIIRALALINRERGSQSLGFFDSSGRMIKYAADPLDCLAQSFFGDYINRACRKGWFIAGHTRHATTGAVIHKNAHPFRYGSIIGSHNGMVWHPKDRGYSVDSEYLIDQLNRNKNDYQKALAKIDGYWGLSWFDGFSLYLQAFDNYVYVGRASDGVWYYSSDDDHLSACIGGSVDLHKISDGRTIRFDGKLDDFTELAALEIDETVCRFSWNKSATGSQTSKGTSTATGTGSGAYAWWMEDENDTKAAKKIKKLKRRKAAATVQEGVKTKYDWLSEEETSWFDELAQEAGYPSGRDFMLAEGITSESQALAFLEDTAFQHQKRENDIEVWEDYANREDK